MHYTHTLINGIRIIHKPIISDVAHCGIIINTGTRDEQDNQHGLAHFTEHMLFKGTKKRKVFHILSRMEDVGGEIDAYTTKEETCISSSFLNTYYERAIELINDIIFNSSYPQKELEKEREVIIDEINSYKDSPADKIFDDFEELIYPNHALGRNILGTKKLLKKYKSNDIQKFVNENYNTDQMVFCSIGNIDFKKLVYLCTKFFEQNPPKLSNKSRTAFSQKITSNKTLKLNTHQAHCIMGTYAYSFRDPKRITLFMLTNLLAGPAMNSILTMTLREKKGISYNIESNYSAYQDTGSFNIYFGCDKDKVDIAKELIFEELIKLKTTKLGLIKLNKLKKQIIGQIAIGNEMHTNLLLAMGKSFLIYNKFESLQDISTKINQISETDILEVANEILEIDSFSSLLYY